MKRWSFKKQAGGFSLLEVLVAFVVLALIGTALFRLFGGALNNADASDAWSRAVLVAQNQLAQATQVQPLQETTASGTDGDVRWMLQVSPYELPPDPGAGGGAGGMQMGMPPGMQTGSMMYKLYRVQVLVTFPGFAGKDRSLVLETIKISQQGLLQ